MGTRTRLSLFWVCFMAMAAFITGCGSKEDEKTYQDILTETEQLSYGVEQVDTSDMINYVYLGSQYYEGERIQIWGERKLEGGNVYLHREDGSRELLAEGVQGFYVNGKWWIDRDKRCYSFFAAGINHISDKGSVVFEVKLESDEILSSFCQLEDGRIVLLRDMMGQQGQKVAELDPQSGSLTNLADIPPEARALMIAAEGNGLVLLDSLKGIWDMNLADGTVSRRISFEGTSYVMPASVERRREGFRLLEDGAIELLWSDGTAEILKLEDLGAGKESLVLRIGYINSWLKEQIVKFNQENEKYYVVIEECQDDDLQSFIDRTEIELGTGAGADIIGSYAVMNVYALLEKGVFADLTPFMEQSGVREDDFFPAAFSSWKKENGIYGLSYTVQPTVRWMEQSVTGGVVPSDIEELMDALLAYEKDATFLKGNSARNLLYSFLQYSENLCGMVDLEADACDFQGELFEKILTAAKRYGYNDPKNTAENIAGTIYYVNFYTFYDSQVLAGMERMPLGYWFDDGWRARQEGDILAINNASSKKEGAWEFLLFLLSDEVQRSFKVDSILGGWVYFPVSRNVFKELCAQHSEIIEIEQTLGEPEYYSTLTEDRKRELEAVLESARAIPFWTRPLLEIIQEEAEAYFSDSKSIDEIRDLIENRVRLYLDEKK